MPPITKLLYSPFLQNKFVLYGSLVVLLLAIIRFLANHNFNAIILMALIGLLTSYFSKNMIIVLLTPLLAIFVIELTRGHMMLEGLENKEKTTEGEETQKPANGDEPAEEPASETKPTTTEGQTGQTPADEADKNKKTPTPPVEKISTQRPAKKQGMAKLKPASYDGKEDHDEKTSNNGNRIDYASTLEQAYDNIENIIGEDGVRGLTDQTKSLMNQQKQLMNNMKDIEPLLKSAQGFMAQMTGEGGLSGISTMLQGFAGTAKKSEASA